MKNGFLTILIMLFALPAFTPWLPHGSVHALHDHQTEHHQVESHGHLHDSHDHGTQTQVSSHHPINLDAVSYYSDFLHVDLKSPEQIILKAPTLDTQDIDYTFTAVIKPTPRYQLASVQSRAPPDTRRHSPDKTPLYLSTQRLRI